MKVLVVVDMQNDFVDGALGSKEACAIVSDVVKAIEGQYRKSLRGRRIENEGACSSGYAE